MSKSIQRKLTVLGVALLVLIVSVASYSFLIGGFWHYGLILLGAGVLFSCLFLFLPLAFKDKELLTSTEGKKPSKLKEIFYSKEKATTFLFEAVAVILNVIFITRFLMGHDYLENVSGLQSDFLSPFGVASGAILLCYQAVVIFYIVGAQFLPSKKTEAITKWVGGIVLLFTVFFFHNVLGGLLGNIISEPFSWRGAFFALEVGIEIAFVVKTWASNPSPKLTKEEGYSILSAVIILLIVSINDYLPKNLFGESIQNIPTAKGLSWTHRVFVYLTFLLPILYFCLLYPQDYSHRRYLLYVIASGALFAYASIRRYETWTSVYSLPLHLCNTAMYIMPLTLIFKNYWLFYFTMFVNVIGAFFALMMPNFSDALPIFGNQTFEFYINHMYATFMPVLIILLKIYERPKWKYFLYSMIGFLAYFVLVAALDIYFDGQGISVDFFFLNSDFIVDKLGSWAENIYLGGLVVFENGGFTYTIRVPYLVGFFLTYVLLSLGMWFIYEVLFVLVDGKIAIMDKAISRKERKKDFTPIANHEISLVATNVSKSYPGNTSPSLKNFSISLHPGKIYGFLGNNGAGKSTFIKACVGLHDFQQGSIKICGYDISFEAQKAKSVMAYVPDHYALEEQLSGREYVSYMASLYQVRPEKQKELVEHFLPLLSLVKAYDRPIRTYSHGMKQKITLLGALVHSPEIIILDEPLTGVDPESVYEIKKVLLQIAEEGRLVFFSSHMIDIVEAICDQAIIIKNGEFVDSIDLNSISKKGGSIEEALLLKMNGNVEVDPSMKKAKA